MVVGQCASHSAAEALAQGTSPPVWTSDKACAQCMLCDASFAAVFKLRHHCRNCGACVCDACSSVRWPNWALPPLYLKDRGGFRDRVRVCRSCDDAAKKFHQALLDGDWERASTLHSLSGNINLRSPLPFDSDRVYPIHLAAQSGSIQLLQWLIITQHCTPGVKTKSGMSTIEFAASAIHIDALSWLVRTGACTVRDIRDKELLYGALHAALETHHLETEFERTLVGMDLAAATVAADAGFADVTSQFTAEIVEAVGVERVSGSDPSGPVVMATPDTSQQFD